MLHAKKTGLASKRYEITRDGQPLTVVEARSGGKFQLDGAGYRLGTRQLLAADGSVIASAHRPGRREWSVESGGEVLRFRRTGRRDHARVDEAGNTIGTLSARVADLPGVAPELQVFALALLVMRARRRRVVVVVGS
ncbi:hypothetical protein [Amycolatopsis silviterrae]|uniref:Uncharacterized protein n=1 Tax=Amycolatopsis silviterrae TaxID=1656914 RepID=A0ABW5HGS1_9PSEU